MKKLTIAVVLALGVSLLFAGFAVAMGHVVAGEVTAIDAKAGTVTVKTDKGDVTVAVSAANLGSLKTGDKVTMETEDKGGKKTATKVEAKKARKPVVGC